MATQQLVNNVYSFRNEHKSNTTLVRLWKSLNLYLQNSFWRNDQITKQLEHPMAHMAGENLRATRPRSQWQEWNSFLDN